MSKTVWKGTRGQPVRAITNSFEIVRLPVKSFYQFDAIVPEVKNFLRRQEIIDKLQTVVSPNSFTPRALYDGMANMYASHNLKLAGGSGTFTVSMTEKHPEREDRNRDAPSRTRGVFEVRIMRVGGNEINPNDLNKLIQGIQNVPTTKTIMATSLLQLLIRQAPNASHPNNGRAYFTAENSKSLGGGLQLWRGYFQSIRPTLGRMLVNVDTTSTAVYKSGNLVDVALDVLKKSDRSNIRMLEAGPREDNFRQLQQFLKNVRISVNTDGTPRKYTIRSLVERAGMFEFDKDNAPCTIAQHFQQAYNINLRYPRIFGVCVSPRNAERTIVFPAEICSVLPGQLYKKKIPESLAGKAVVDFATLSPRDRLNAIQYGFSNNRSVVMASPVTQYATSSFLIDAGMQISTDPIVISGRLLDTPNMVFGGGEEVRPADGSWNVVKKILKVAKPLNLWAVINYESHLPPAVQEEFIGVLKSCCRNLGMGVNDPLYKNGNAHAPEEALAEIVRQSRGQVVDLVLVILPKSAAHIRAKVKQWGDVHQGIMTQCVREDKLWNSYNKKYKANEQYCNNVAIKINARLGGDNSVPNTLVMNRLRAPDPKGKFHPYMVVGADVGHPAPGANQPSISSLVWSWDQWACRYSAVSRVQSPRTEIIAEMKDMFKIALNDFVSRNRQPPERIFIFRDGVSENELQQVSSVEIMAIKAAIDELWALHRSVTAPKPCLTFIIVGKRHHIRFFPKDQSGADRSGNCHAGFIADEGLSSPIAKDFYLQSHGGLKGTSRPSHYIVLLDENFMLAIDDLQELCFALCHVYAKATRSVSIPAPVYYADLVCSRAKFYFSDELRFAETNMTSSGDNTFDLERWKEGFYEIHTGIIRAMYFL